MKLTLQIKLMPTKDQANLLLQTMREANKACNDISDIAWRSRVFNQFKLHHACYNGVKQNSTLASQMIVRCISKVACGYKLDKKIKRAFKPLGGIAYDSRILNYKLHDIISIWCIGGRQKMPFICHNRNYLPFIKGEADLLYRNGKFFLLQCIDMPDNTAKDAEEFIGVDFGLVEIASLSNGTKYNSKTLTEHREKRQKVRSSLQSKGTKNARRVLKRLSGKEKRAGTIINHTISKSIVALANVECKGIAIEDLTGIRFSSFNKSKKFRSRVGKWSFFQLRQFLEYKALLAGVPLVVVEPRYTSKTCHVCHNIGDRAGKSFKCKNCGVDMDADVNASLNIAALGAAINQPENSAMYCVLH